MRVRSFASIVDGSPPPGHGASCACGSSLGHLSTINANSALIVATKTCRHPSRAGFTTGIDNPKRYFSMGASALAQRVIPLFGRTAATNAAEIRKQEARKNTISRWE